MILDTELELQLEKAMDTYFDDAADSIATAFRDNFDKPRLNEAEINAVLSRLKVRLVTANVVW